MYRTLWMDAAIIAAGATCVIFLIAQILHALLFS